jgi:hypothetical protein
MSLIMTPLNLIYHIKIYPVCYTLATLWIRCFLHFFYTLYYTFSTLFTTLWYTFGTLFITLLVHFSLHFGTLFTTLWYTAWDAHKGLLGIPQTTLEIP